MSGLRTTVVAIALLAAQTALADTYPVSGTWTYDNATAKGPAKICGPRIMRFAGDVRHDTETSAPDYRNMSVRKTSATTWRIDDQFSTVQIWGRVHYTLRVIDEDHIEIEYDKGGSRLLRRCAL